jgi:hypothetical protein
VICSVRNGIFLNVSYKMDRFEHAEPRLTSGEQFIIGEKGVRLYDGDDKVSFQTNDTVEYIVCCCAMQCVVVDIYPIMERSF